MIIGFRTQARCRLELVCIDLYVDDCLWVIFNIRDLIGASYRYFLNSKSGNSGEWLELLKVYFSIIQKSN
jgi:hypothetical protein